jgi:hypothetical protein
MSVSSLSDRNTYSFIDIPVSSLSVFCGATVDVIQWVQFPITALVLLFAFADTEQLS